MSASTTDPVAPARLPTLSEALDITVTTDPLECTISVLYPNGAWDVVYQDGVFAQAYTGSTRDGSDFQVRRVGGWPPGVQWRVRVKEGGVATPIPALLPAGYAGALAQWSCLRVGNTIPGTDRSGNAYHMTSANPVALSDLIPGQAALAPKGNGDPAAPATLTRAATAALVLHGEVTIIARVCLAGYNFQGVGGYVCGLGNFSSAVEAANVPYAMVCEQVGTDTSRLVYFCQTGPSKTDVIAYSNVVSLNDGQWHFCCIRRSSDGTVVDIQVDADSKQTTGLSAPTGGSTSFPRCGGDFATTPAELLNGLQADCNIVGRRITDDEVAAARAIMMGL